MPVMKLELLLLRMLVSEFPPQAETTKELCIGRYKQCLCFGVIDSVYNMKGVLSTVMYEAG